MENVTVGEALIRLIGNSAPLKQTLSEAKGQTDAWARQVGQDVNRNLGQSIASGIGGAIKGAVGAFAVGGLAVQGVKAIGGAVAGLTNSLISGNAAFEDYTVQFGVLFKSAEKARTRMAELAKFGAQTPFELDELVRADKILVAFGLDTEQTVKRFGVSGASMRTTIGDIASGVGASYEEVSMIFGRIASGASGEAIMRMSELGITTREQMTQWGITFTKAGSMTTAPDKAIAILQKHLGDRFKGMMDQSSKTWNGMLSNVADFAHGALRTLMQSSFDKVLEPRLQKILALLGDPKVQKALESWGKRIASGLGLAFSALDRLVGGLRSASQLANSIGSALGVDKALGTVKGVGGALADALFGPDTEKATTYHIEKAKKRMLDPLTKKMVVKGGKIHVLDPDVQIDKLGVFEKKLKNLTGIDLKPTTNGLKGLLDTFKTGTISKTAFDSVNKMLGLDPSKSLKVLEVVQRLGNGFRLFGQYLSALGGPGNVANAVLAKMPGWFQPIAIAVGGVIKIFDGLVYALNRLFTGKFDFAQFFGSIKTNIQQNGHVIWDAFADVGKRVWGYLFARDDATGTSKVGEFVTWAKGKLETKARETFAEAKGLGLDLWAFLFGGKTSNGSQAGSQVGTFLDSHKTLITTLAKTAFGPLGVIASYLLPFLFGKNEDGTTKASTFLAEVKGWFTPENVAKVFNDGKALISDIWGFLFGKVDLKDDKPTWVDGILGPLVKGLQAGLAKLPSLIGDVGDFLFGKTITVTGYGAGYGTKKRVNGLIDTFTTYIGDAFSKIPWGAVLSKATGVGEQLGIWLISKVKDIPASTWTDLGAAYTAAMSSVIITILLAPKNINIALDTGEGDAALKGLGEKIGLMISGALVKALASDSKSAREASDALTSQGFLGQLTWAGARIGLKIGEGIYQGMLDGFDAQIGDDLGTAILASLTRGMSPVVAGAIYGALGLPAETISNLIKRNADAEKARLAKSLSGSVITTKGLNMPVTPQANPLAQQMETLFDPDALGIPDLGQRIGASLTDGIAKGLAAGQGAIAVALDLMLTPRLALAQADTIDAMTQRMNPYRPARAR